MNGEQEEKETVGQVYWREGHDAEWEKAERNIRGGEEEMRGWDANNGEISIEELKEAEGTNKQVKEWRKDINNRKDRPSVTN